MKNIVVVGSQWGDEGKGKIVDWLSEQADVVIRFQGGHNAGHTLIVDGKKIVFHLLPSAICHDDIHCYIGRGVVVSLDALFEEIEEAQEVIVNMCFNMGAPRLSKFKKFIGGVNAGDWNTAAVEMMDSRWAKQVGVRADRLRDRIKALA